MSLNPTVQAGFKSFLNYNPLANKVVNAALKKPPVPTTGGSLTNINSIFNQGATFGGITINPSDTGGQGILGFGGGGSSGAITTTQTYAPVNTVTNTISNAISNSYQTTKNLYNAITNQNYAYNTNITSSPYAGSSAGAQGVTPVNTVQPALTTNQTITPTVTPTVTSSPTTDVKSASGGNDLITYIIIGVIAIVGIIAFSSAMKKRGK